MKKILLLILFVIYSSIFLNCASSSSNDNKNRLGSHGELTNETYQTLIKLLEKFDGQKSKDTIIIKYDYENGSCWDALDLQSDDYIQKVIENSQKRIKKNLEKRPNISVYRFSEPGSRFNKIIERNKTILKDTDHKLFNLIFARNSSCGNSFLITPDRKYIFKKSDPHFEMLDLSPEEIAKMQLD